VTLISTSFLSIAHIFIDLTKQSG
jgi:hypothetical protein